MQGQLWIVAAPSGGGKTSLIAATVQTLDDVVESVSHTTRAARPGELMSCIITSSRTLSFRR